MEGLVLSLSVSPRPRHGRRQHHGLPDHRLLLHEYLQSHQSSAEWKLLLDAFRNRYPKRPLCNVYHYGVFFFYDCICILTQQLLSPLSAVGSWIQVNLGQTRKVTGIVIQGCPQGDNWVTKFRIQHSMERFNWTDYTADGAVSERALRFILSKRRADDHFGFFCFSSFCQARRTETLPSPSCSARPCRRSTSASLRWRSTVWQASALRCWGAHQTVRHPPHRCYKLTSYLFS